MDASIMQEMQTQLQIKPRQIQAVLELLDEGNTIPFIARYRKEATGSLDEVQIHDIQQVHHRLSQMKERREDILTTIKDQGKLTPDLAQALEQATTMQQLEDLYRPYRKRRQTLADKAIEAGLEPLADWLLSSQDQAPQEAAQAYLSEEVPEVQDALDGAHEIIAQRVSDQASFREFIRKYTRYNGHLVTSLKKGGEEEDPRKVYHLYYDFKVPLQHAESHQVLAINRGEKEEVLTVKVEVPEGPAINYMESRFVTQELPQVQRDLIHTAIEDAYKRFIGPAIEREMRNDLTAQAERQAIDIFGNNLRSLLLQAPLKGQVILGFDPAFRTGCKLAVISPQGEFLDKLTIFPHTVNDRRLEEEKAKFIDLLEKHQVELIAIGNGTASRESEQFVADAIQDLSRPISYAVVNEAGASVYSASANARAEFPDLEVEERSAISIARRVQDPLAELIKIDPKSLGIGQYQHDVTQGDLNEALDFVVNTTVNQVGVDINTASSDLLQHVSGLSRAVAQNVVDYRTEIGTYTDRREIQEVKRLGPKTYEQSVGFLRILGGDNPLDQTSIHPESYPLAMKILEGQGIDLSQLGQEEANAKLAALDLATLAEDYQVGQETLADIIQGLMHPSADIRDDMDGPLLREDVLSIEDLSEGLRMEGVVRNVVDFGAFVDLGVGEDGLIHRSKMGIKRHQHPLDRLSVGDIVPVEILSVDVDKGRIGLELRD